MTFEAKLTESAAVKPSHDRSRRSFSHPYGTGIGRHAGS